MTYYVTLNKYMEILKDSIDHTYNNGKWHPEDLESVIEHTNTIISRTLQSIDGDGGHSTWMQVSSPQGLSPGQ
jgi:hypothetical protein